MSQDKHCMPTDVVLRFLEHDLPEREEASIVAHLDHCATCQQQLEKLAGEADEWKQISDSLIRLSSRADGSINTEERRPESATDVVDSAADILSYLAPTDDPQMLGRLGGYEVAGVVGRGGMGIVLKGYDRPLNRVVAIKVLSPELSFSANARQRFAREARAAAAVVHEHVIAIYSVAEHRGLPYLVMPYLAGPSVARRIERSGALSALEVLRISRQVAVGLAAAHEQGLVHRDVKPANILLEADVERVTITDFGLARAVDDVSVTQTGVIAGTPQYMSPEQACGDAIDHRSDLFSLGSVMYTMCTAVPPFRGDATMTVLRKICDEEPRPIRDLNPEIPPWLADIVHKLHRKSPKERFQSAAEVAGLLEAWLVHLQQPALHPAPSRLGRYPQARLITRSTLRAVASLIVLLAIGFADWSIGRVRSPDSLASPGPRDDEPKVVGSPIAVTAESIPALCFSGDGHLLAVAHGNQSRSTQPGAVRLWSVPERTLLETIREERGVHTIAISRDGNLAAFGTYGHVVKVVELPGGREVHRTSAGWGSPVAFSSDGKLLAIAAHPKLVELWDTASWTRRDIDFDGDLPPWALLSIRFSPDDSLIAVGGGVFPPKPIYGQAAVWQVSTGKRVVAVKANASVMQVDFSPDGRQLATASLEARATLWSLDSGLAVHSYRDLESGLHGVGFLDDGDTVVTLGPRSGIKLFATREETPFARLRSDEFRMLAMSILSGRGVIASGGTDGKVRIWDANRRHAAVVLDPREQK